MNNPSKVIPINPLHQETLEDRGGINVIQRNFPEDAFLSEEKKRRSTSALTVDDQRDSLREDELEARLNHLLKVRDVQNRSIRSTIKNNLKIGKGRNHNYRHSVGGGNNVMHYVRAGTKRINSLFGHLSSWFLPPRRNLKPEVSELQGPLIDQHVSEAEDESDSR